MSRHGAHSRRARAAGFTLIEVMIAMGILGVALFVLLQAQHSGLRLHARTADVLLEKNLMQQALAQAEVDVLAGNLTGTGEFGKRFPDYSYAYDARQMSENIPGLFTVAVTLEGPGDPREMTVLVYDPRQ